MPKPHVQVIIAEKSIPQPLRMAMNRLGASAGFWPLSEALRHGLPPTADAVIIVAPPDTKSITTELRVLLDRIADHPRATLILKSDGDFVHPIAHPAVVPVTFGCPLDEVELTIRLRMMLEMRHSLDALHGAVTANRQSEEDATKRYQSQLRLASQVQRELLPETTPNFQSVSFNTVFKPADYVSGDIYDFRRLDENHIGIALADATGHGIPAALLTVFIKRALRGKEINNGSYRLLRPDEVLTRLNDDLLEANMSECRFVATAYAVYNTQTRELALARGGAPYPLLRRANGDIELLRPPGGVVGVIPDATFAVERTQLEPGDTLLLYSDGLEAIVLPQMQAGDIARSFQRAADTITRYAATSNNTDTDDDLNVELHTNTAVSTLEPPTSRNGDGKTNRTAFPHQATTTTAAQVQPDEWITTSSWYETLRHQGIRPALDELNLRHGTLRRMGFPLDDLTAIAMTITA